MCLCSQSPFLTTSPGNHQPNFCPYSFAFSTVSYKWNHTRGTWVAQAVKRPTSAQVMISRSVSSSPASDSVLTAQSLEPASDSVSPCLSTPSPFALHLSLSLKNKWTLKKINKWNHTVCSLLWLVPFSIILLRFIHVCFFFNFFNVYLFLRNREHKQERGRERERDTEPEAGSRLCQRRAQYRAWTCGTWDHGLSQSRSLIWLSHPGTPETHPCFCTRQ